MAARFASSYRLVVGCCPVSGVEGVAEASLCGADISSLSDTTGQGSTDKVIHLCTLMKNHSTVPWGAHMHSTYDTAGEKALAAISAGCERIDTALKGYGGCPFASDQLIGNMPTEKVLSALTHANIAHTLDPLYIESAYNSAVEVLGRYS